MNKRPRVGRISQLTYQQKQRIATVRIAIRYVLALVLTSAVCFCIPWLLLAELLGSYGGRSGNTI